jgi:hypothetical protein
MVLVGVQVELLQVRVGHLAEVARHRLLEHLLERVHARKVTLQRVRLRKEHLALEKKSRTEKKISHWKKNIALEKNIALKKKSRTGKKISHWKKISHCKKTISRWKKNNLAL